MDLDYDITPVAMQPVRGVRKREGYIDVEANEIAGEFVAVEKFAPKGWDERWAREVA